MGAAPGPQGSAHSPHRQAQEQPWLQRGLPWSRGHWPRGGAWEGVCWAPFQETSGRQGLAATGVGTEHAWAAASVTKVSQGQVRGGQAGGAHMVPRRAVPLATWAGVSFQHGVQPGAVPAPQLCPRGSAASPGAQGGCVCGWLPRYPGPILLPPELAYAKCQLWPGALNTGGAEGLHLTGHSICSLTTPCFQGPAVGQP